MISCGRKSVYLSIYLKKKFKNIITIHIQNPKINFQNFNFIIAPQHDYIKGNNVISSVGALHKFTKSIIEKEIDSSFNISKQNLISVIIGGDNQHYKFSIKEINELSLKIKKIKKLNPDYNFLIISSRRTTLEMKKVLKDNLKNIAIIWKENGTKPSQT